MDKFSAWIIRRAGWVIAGTLLLTVVLGLGCLRLEVNPDMLDYLPESDPVVKLSNQVGEQYGGNAMAIVALEAGDVFTPGVLGAVDRLTRDLQRIPGVKSVTSLTQVLDIRQSPDGLEIGRLLSDGRLPTTPAECRQLKTYTLSKRLLAGSMVSRDARLTLIVCQLYQNKIKVSQDIKRAVRSRSWPAKVYYSGLPFQLTEVTDMIVADLKLLLPVVATVIAAVLLLSFRSLLGVVLPLASVGISLIWTLGVMGWLRVPLTVISNVIPVVIIAVGSAYSIHVLSKFNEQAAAGDTAGETARKTLQQIMLPVFLAGITTIIGFITFVFGSYLTMIREFGYFSALGVVFTLVNSLTLVPAWLSRLRLRPRPDRAAGGAPGPAVRRWAGFLLRRRTMILLACLLLAVACGLGIPRIQRQVDFLDYFKPGTDIRRAEETIGKYFGGSVPLHIVVKGDIQDPQVLARMQAMTAFLETLPQIHHPRSIADYLEEMNEVMGEGRRLPDTREKVSNLLFLLEGEDVRTQMVNADDSEALITAMQRSAFTRDNNALIGRIESEIKRLNSPGCTFALTGAGSVYRNLDRSLLASQFRSLSLALLLIGLCLTGMLRSWRKGLIGLLPIVLSLLAVFGLMGFTGLPLDVATVLVASISIGIGIDYSIHMVSRLNEEARAGGPPPFVLARTLATTGRAVIINAVTVTLGFLVLLAANLVPLERFGALIALTMTSSSLGALTMIPVLLLPASAAGSLQTTEHACPNKSVNERAEGSGG